MNDGSWLHFKMATATGDRKKMSQTSRFALKHGRLQDFETTWAKIKGWGLKGVSMGVVVIIIGCGHLLMDPGHA